jgi:glycosyltransferase involved in cell wall biosynthesis
LNVLFVYRYLTLGGVEAVLRTRLAALGQQGIQARVWFLSDGPGHVMFAADDTRVRVGGLDEFASYWASEPADILSVIDTPEVLELPSVAATAPRVVLEVHTPYAENRTYLNSRGCGVARAVIVPSQHQAGVVRREMRFPPPVLVVPNPIDEAFMNPPAIEQEPVGHPIVAWIGRIDSLKDWRGFVQLAREVLHELDGVVFWVIGRGTMEQEDEFYRACRASGVLGRLRWLRGVAQDRMPSLLDRVRGSGGVVVSTSRGESFGLAVAEAMARACAVVVPRAGPFPEYIHDHRTGLLYRARRPKDGAAKTIEFLRSPSLREECGQRARKYILETHSPEASCRALASVFESVSGLGEPRPQLPPTS